MKAKASHHDQGFYKLFLYVYLKNQLYLPIPLDLYYINPEKPDVPINKNDAFQKVQKRRVQEKR